MTTEAEERVARAIALFFTANQQPDMSGDPLAKLLPHQRRNAYDAARAAIAEINAMAEERSDGRREMVARAIALSYGDDPDSDSWRMCFGEAEAAIEAVRAYDAT